MSTQHNPQAGQGCCELHGRKRGLNTTYRLAVVGGAQRETSLCYCADPHECATRKDDKNGWGGTLRSISGFALC